MKKRMFPQVKGKKIILGEGFPYLEAFAGESYSYVEGIGLEHSPGIVYHMKLPKIRKKQAYRLVLEELPKNWESPFLDPTVKKGFR